MTLTVHLSDDLVRRLRERASRNGSAVEQYVVQLIERDALASGAVESSDDRATELQSMPALSDDEFERLLDDLASGPTLPNLPADFSRADVYADRD